MHIGKSKKFGPIVEEHRPGEAEEKKQKDLDELPLDRENEIGTKSTAIPPQMTDKI